MSQSRRQQSSGGTESRVESLSPERAGLSGTLRLRAEDEPTATTSNGDAGPSRRIRWSEDVVDNEGMGKKSSKVCCIYHKPRPIGESSSEESSDSSSSDSDSDSDDAHAGCGGKRAGKDSSAQPASRGRSTCSHDHRKGQTKRRKPSPNAYEKMPKPKGR